jgi:hypothetical protein
MVHRLYFDQEPFPSEDLRFAFAGSAYSGSEDMNTVIAGEVHERMGDHSTTGDHQHAWDKVA